MGPTKHPVEGDAYMPAEIRLAAPTAELTRAQQILLPDGDSQSFSRRVAVDPARDQTPHECAGLRGIRASPTPRGRDLKSTSPDV